MKIEIYNGTQHVINVYDVKDTTPVQVGRKLVVKEGATPLATIAPGVNLNATKDNGMVPSFTANVPLKGAVKFIGYDPLPAEAEGKLVIVSNLYRAAVKELGGDTSLLATVDGTVYENAEAIRPCGCLGLAVG